MLREVDTAPPGQYTDSGFSWERCALSIGLRQRVVASASASASGRPGIRRSRPCPRPVPRPRARPGSLVKRLLASALLAGLAACQSAPGTGAASGAGIAPFATDGCSMFPDRSPGGKTDWCSCCVAHDLAYWRGGSLDERLAADRALKGCVGGVANGVLLAHLMYAGVRLGGSPALPTPYRWGFGWPYGRGYQRLSAQEEAQVATLRAANLAGNPTLDCSTHACLTPSPTP